MSGINSILYTPIDFSKFILKGLFDSSGSVKTAKGLSDNVGLVDKIIKFSSSFGFANEGTKKFMEQCKSFKNVYSLFTCIPASYDAIKSLGFQPADPSKNTFNSVFFERVVQVVKLAKSFFEIKSAVTEYLDPLGLKSFTPLKYVVDALDVTENTAGIVNDSVKILKEAGSKPDTAEKVRLRNMTILSTAWALCKKITTVAITVIGVVAAVFAGSVAIPFAVLPALGLASVSFGLFNKYVDYFVANPTHVKIA